MRKILFAMLSIVLMLAACGTKEETAKQPDVTEQPNGSEQSKDEEKKPENEPTDLVPISDVLELMSYGYMSGDFLEFKIVVTNLSDEDVNVLAPSGLRYDIVVTNEQGNEVYRYSIDKMGTTAILNEELAAKESFEWTERWDLLLNGNRVDEGTYKVHVTYWAGNEKDEVIEEFTTTYEVTIPEENNAFRHIQIEETEDAYIVTGEARVFEAVFQYSVEDGHDYVVNETPYTLDEGAPAWSPFEVTVKKEDKPINGVLTLVLFERSAKDGEPTNVMTVTLN